MRPGRAAAYIPIPGELGFLALRYTGGAPTPRWWAGIETGTRYCFGGDQRVKLVDRRDAIRFLLGGPFEVAHALNEVDQTGET